LEQDEWQETSERDDFGPAAECVDRAIDEGERLLPSLAFWFCLSVAAAIFAVVFLSPRLRTYRDLHRQYDGLERELVASESNVDYLNRVVEALKHDPDFAAELARADFRVAGSEERFAVAPALRLNGVRTDGESATPDAARPPAPSPLDTPMLDSLSDNRSVRSSLLGAASLLVLVAFTLLCQKRPNLESIESARWGDRLRRWLADRYARSRA
jgi:cell division protein FtsB